MYLGNPKASLEMSLQIASGIIPTISANNIPWTDSTTTSKELLKKIPGRHNE